MIIPIATPAAMIMQNATEDNQIPVVFSAVSDPVGAGLVASADAPGANITGTSDAIDVAQIMDFILAADPDAAKIGFLYDKSGILPQVLFRRQKITAMNMGFPM